MAKITNTTKTITRNGSVSATIPRFNLIITITDSADGSVIQTYNTTFPAVLSQFTAAEQEEMFLNLIEEGIRIKQRNIL